MKEEKVRKELNEKLGNMPWNFNFLMEDEAFQLKNVKTETAVEEDFLEDLKEEGSKKIFRGSGEISYMITRTHGNLKLSIADDEGEPVEEPKEITERIALRVFRESKKESTPLSDLLNIFKREEEPPKELVPNQVIVKYKLVERIEFEGAKGTESLKIFGNGFLIELRSDGGCKLKFTT